MVWDGEWTVVVLSNYDAPAGMMLEMPILDLLAGSTTVGHMGGKKQREDGVRCTCRACLLAPVHLPVHRPDIPVAALLEAQIEHRHVAVEVEDVIDREPSRQLRASSSVE
jgi:hypothetical protein